MHLDKLARSVLAAIIALTIVALAGAILMDLQGYKLLSVQTDSMLPAIRPGDALIIAPAHYKVKPGDVVSYHSPKNPKVIITHRLISADAKTRQLKTQGDKLQRPDPAFSSELLSGKAIAIAPKLGLAIDLLFRPIFLIALIYLPAVLLLSAEVGKFTKLINTPMYRLPGYEWSKQK